MCVCQCFSFQIDVHDQMYQRLPGSSGQPPLFFGYPWHTFFVWMVFIILHAFSFSCLRAKLSSCSSFSVSICVCVLFTQWERWISSGDLVENPLYSPSQLESHKLKSLALSRWGFLCVGDEQDKYNNNLGVLGIRNIFVFMWVCACWVVSVNMLAFLMHINDLLYALNYSLWSLQSTLKLWKK